MHLKTRNQKLLSSIIIATLLTSFFITSLSTLMPTASAESAWWNSQWPNRKAITIDRTKIAGSLTNFPVLIDIIDSDLASKAQTDGDDIVFVEESTNTKLNHEIEYYDPRTGHLIAWVNLPSLSPAADKVLYMYYGNPSAANQQNPTAVWDTNYKMVQHLNETSGTHYDSTLNGNNGSPFGGVTQGVTGKIGGADTFDGNNDYIEVPHESSLTGFTTAFTASFWIKIDDTTRRQAILNKYDSTGNQRAWFIEYRPYGTETRFPSFFASADGSNYRDWYASFTPAADEWYYVTVVWQSNTLPRFYINGQQVTTMNTGTISQIYNNNAPLHIARCTFDATRYLKGSLDEIRIINTAQSANWIQTSYNNQQNPSTFISLGLEETYTGAPTISNEKPQDGATNVYTNPELSISVTDNDLLTITFETDATGTWQEIKRYENVPSGTYTAIPTTLNQLGTQYRWRVSVTDGTNTVSKTYSFTTTTTILQSKWTATGVPRVSIGALVADVVGDSRQEIIHAGEGGVTVLDGTTGSVIWSVPLAGATVSAQFEIADLNNDGIFEIIVATEYPARLHAFNGNNGSLYWSSPILGGMSPSDPVVADIDGDGYPTIFVATMWTSETNNDGKLTALSHDGRILQQVWTWHPCAGGLALADADGDGEFELYLGDRNTGSGLGVSSYWARNLTMRWYRNEIMCSSHRPMLVDVNGDGILDVIIGHHRGGVAVYDSRDGRTISQNLNIPNDAPVHYQPSVYDIDGDGNLEILMADGEHNNTANDIVVWDLVLRKVDARIPVVAGKYGPQVADVTGDGYMDIIICNNTDIFIYDRTYTLVAMIKGLAARLMNPVVQDIDGDDYNELVVASEAGRIYTFDTPARAPSPRARTEVRFYSERRLGAAEYVPTPGPAAPQITEPAPPDGATSIPISLSKLTFKLTDYQRDPITYTVTTSPNIGSVSGINVPNGIITVPVSGLAYSTTYSWTVTATDGTNINTKTFAFTTSALPPWYNTDWQYRKTIIIDHTKVSGDQINFPVLIDIIDSSLATKAQADGDDFVFTDASNIKLDHQIEFYDSTIGRLIAWVNVPYLSSTADTVLYLYYGNSVCGSQQNPSAVWDSSYKLVLHLNEQVGMHYDSTVNANDGAPLNGVVQGVPCRIDGGDAFDGANDYIEIPHSNTLAGYTEAVTVSFWIKLQDTSRRQTIINKYDTTGNQRGWFIEYDPTVRPSRPFAFFASYDGVNYREWYANFVPTAGVWYHVTVVWAANAVPRFYVNGVQVSTVGTATIPSIYNNPNTPLFIGRCPYNNARYFSGSLDEITISNPARSAGWIQTSYNNQLNPALFYSISEEETFEEYYTLTIHINGLGTVSANPEKQYYKLGDTVTLTATPESGYAFQEWRGDITSTDNPVTITITKNMVVTAYFSTKEYTITSSVSGEGGTILPVGLVKVSHGADQTFTITPDDGYHVLDVVVDGESQGPLATYTFTNVNADHTIAAIFAKNEYTLTVNVLPEGSGTVTLNCSAPYYHGDGVELTAEPNSGWYFSEWTGDLSGNQNPVTIIIDGDKTITAIFTQQPQQQYTLTIDVVGSGSVENNPAKSTYAEDEQVTLTATASPGYRFQGWSGDITSTDNPLTITMDSSKTLTATFVPEQYVLTINIEGQGSVNKNPDQETYLYGDSVELTPTAEEGWEFSYWSGDLSGSNTPATIIITEDTTVTAHFTQIQQQQYTLSITTVGNGIVTKNPDYPTYADGAIVELTAVADPGWTFSHWSGDATGNSNPITVTMDRDKTVTAHFAQILLTDSTFDASADDADLRTNSMDQDWYESRNDLPILLTLDTTTVGGNSGKKAALKNYNTARNAYLTQEFSSPQTGTFTVSFDIYIDRITDSSNYDRTGHVYIGCDSSDRGPNGYAQNRSICLAFYDSTPGTSGNDIQIKARTSSTQSWSTTSQWVTIKTGLSYDTWYTITLVINVASGTYDVYVNGALASANIPKYDNYPLNYVTHISFAADSDARGDFYVDNVIAIAAVP